MHTLQKPNNNQSRRPQSRPKPAAKTVRIDISKYVNDDVVVPEAEVYQAVNRFEDFVLHPKLILNIKNRGFVNPTEIQDKSILEIKKGIDLIGLAGTGTGKTAAFLIPIVQQLLERPTDNAALIITPTRELANQIMDEFQQLTRGMGLHASVLIGGVSPGLSVKALSRPNNIIIGTPGRLLDMADRGSLRLAQFQRLVLDEFDRMLDMGFIRDITKINNRMISKNQTLLFSATMDPAVKKNVDELTNNPVIIRSSVGTHQTSAIQQEVVRVPAGKQKMDVLMDLLRESGDRKVILFCETKHKVNKVGKKLQASGFSVEWIHGDKSQNARETALKNFKSGKSSILVATDVVARGIDVSDVYLVINFESPKNYNDYVHRIGRTGRAGQTGRAITLLDNLN